MTKPHQRARQGQTTVPPSDFEAWSGGCGAITGMIYDQLCSHDLMPLSRLRSLAPVPISLLYPSIGSVPIINSLTAPQSGPAIDLRMLVALLRRNTAISIARP